MQQHPHVSFRIPIRQRFQPVERPVSLFSRSRPFKVRRWFKSTSRRTFIVYPVLVIALDLLVNQGELQWSPWGVLILVWGYVQYKASGHYRTARGGGGPGIDVPPERIVDSGIYAYSRNPMYLGHLIFMVGLVITFHSVPAALLLVFHLFWYQRRVREDELRLIATFGDEYRTYMNQVKRWIPGMQ